LKKFFFRLFINLNMAITMGSDFMPLAINHLHNLWVSFCNISKNEESGLDFKTVEKGEDLLDIGQDSVLTLIPARRGKNAFDITDVIPVLHIHR